MKKRYILFILLFIFFFGINKVGAMTLKPSGATSGKTGQEIKLYVTLNRTLNEKTISAVDGTFSYDESALKLISFKSLMDNWTELSEIGNNQKFSYANLNFKNLITKTSQDILELNFKINDNANSGNTTISVSNTSATDENGDGVSIFGGSHTVKILSNVNTLSNITVTGATLNFNENTTTYSLEVNSANVTINATKKDNASSVSGDTGTKLLQYGLNTFKINVTSESGKQKVYTLNITRKDNRDSEVRLKSLEPINNFTMGTTLYNVTLPSTQDTYTVNAIPMSNKAKVNISPSATIKLNPGEKKSITITVTAENGNTKTYTVNVTRKDDRSKDNTLKKLSIKDIDINFKTSKTSYTATIENNVEEIEINGEASDKNAKITGLGKHKINVGSNTIRVVVTAENGTTKTYTITIIRKDENGNVEQLSNNTKLKSIKVNNQNLAIKENVFTYSLSVENNINIVDLIYELEDEKATAVIEGNNELTVGNNKFKIIVTAENGTTKTYEILIERKELNNSIENNKDKILEAIKNNEIDTITITVKNNDSNRIIEKEILEELKKESKKLIYEILNENQGLSYSITIDSEDITDTTNSLNYDLLFKCKNQSTIDNLINNKKSICLSFNDSEKLPALIKFKIFVGDKFNDKDKLFLYYFNEDTNKLELVKSNLNVENKYVEFELNHFSEYILVDSLINENPVSNSNDNLRKVVGVGIALFIVIGLLIFIVIKNKKNKSKINQIDNNIKEDIKSETNSDTINNALIKENKEPVEESKLNNNDDKNNEQKEKDETEIIDM